MACIRALRGHLGVDDKIRAPKEKGRYRSVHRGRFQVLYEDEWKEYLPQILAFLAQCQGVYEKRGLPIARTIPVYISRNTGKKTAIAWYVSRNSKLNPENKQGALLFAPQHLGRSDGLETCVHEVAHYVHNELIPGGFSNATIKSKYDSVKDTPDTGASVTEELLDQIATLKKEAAKVMRQQVRSDPRVKKLGATSFKYLYPDFKVYVEYPDGTADWGSSIYSAAHDLKDETLDMMIEHYRGELKALADTYHAAVEGERDPTQYKRWRSKWIITDYAKTNALEWFAEGMTAVLLHPEDADPEVREWMMDTAKTSLTGDAAEAHRSEKAQRQIDTTIPKLSLPAGWRYTEVLPSSHAVSDGMMTFRIHRKIDWRGKAMNEWVLEVQPHGERGMRQLSIHSTPHYAVDALRERLFPDQNHKAADTEEERQDKNIREYAVKGSDLIKIKVGDGYAYESPKWAASSVINDLGEMWVASGKSGLEFPADLVTAAIIEELEGFDLFGGKLPVGDLDDGLSVTETTPGVTYVTNDDNSFVTLIHREKALGVFNKRWLVGMPGQSIDTADNPDDAISFANQRYQNHMRTALTQDERRKLGKANAMYADMVDDTATGSYL